MNLKAQLEAAQKAFTAAMDRLNEDDTEANLKAAEEAAAKVKDIQDRLRKMRLSNASLDALSAEEHEQVDSWETPKPKQGDPVQYKGMAPGGRSAQGSGFANSVKTALDAYGMKSTSLVSGSPLTVPHAGNILSDPRPSFGLQGLVARQLVEGGSGQYLQQTLRQNKAATVAREAVKPTSAYGIEAKRWQLATIAHLTGPVARQWLEDIPTLLEFLGSELAYGLSEAVDEFILNGGTDENGNAVTGILNNSGIDTEEYAVSPLRTIRASLTSLQLEGTTATGIALHPRAWEEIEVSEDLQGRPLLTQTAGTATTRNLYGVPVALVAGLDEATAVVADWSSIVLLERGAYQITATEHGTPEAPPIAEGAVFAGDTFARNQVRFRAETRNGLLLGSLPAIRKVELEA